METVAEKNDRGYVSNAARRCNFVQLTVRYIAAVERPRKTAFSFDAAMRLMAPTSLHAETKQNLLPVKVPKR